MTRPRPNTPLHRRPRGGFTLVELLVGMVIGVMILGAAAASMTAVLGSWDRGSRKYELLQIEQKTSALIERHLRSALSPADGEYVEFYGEDLTLDPEHPGHRLTMRSTAPGRFPRNLPPVDSAEVTFEYDPSYEDGFTMRIQAPPDDLPEEGGYLLELSPRIVGFRVLYFDGAEWIEEWYGQDTLPQAAEFHLLINTGDDLETFDENTPVDEITRLVWLPLGQGTPENQLLSILDESEDQTMPAENAGEERSGDSGNQAESGASGNAPAAGGRGGR